MEVKPITISFKKTIEDKELFDWLVSHSNFSGFIKDVLRKEMKCYPVKEVKVEKNNSLIELGDF